VAANTGVINPLASFNGTNGAHPAAALIMDASGNFYGTTSSGGDHGDGTIFKFSGGAITVLASFDGSNGANPLCTLVMDASGNLYGTTSTGGNGDGTVFELADGSPTIAVLASFHGPDGAAPDAGLVMDASGNLYGTTSSGGADGYGTVFELPSAGGTPSILASFHGTSGATPLAGLILDGSGNLYGTTSKGGTNGDGTIFTLPSTGGALDTLASFDGSNGATPAGALFMDDNGNLLGTAANGGDSGDGTVFELAHGSSTITPLQSFDGTHGAHPSAGLIIDQGGNLYGTTTGGGAVPNGTVFEIAQSSNATVWTGADSLSNINWSDAFNWSNGVPGPGEIAEFNSYSFSTMDIPLTIAGLLVTGDTTVNISVDAPLLLTGASAFDGGTLNITGATGTVANAGTVLLNTDPNGSGTLLAGSGVFTNNGTISQGGSFDLCVGGFDNGQGFSVKLDNTASGVIDLTSDSGITSGNGYLANEGILEKTGGAGTSNIDVAVMNTATVDAESGTIQFIGVDSSDTGNDFGTLDANGTFKTAPGASIDLARGGYFPFDETATMTVTGAGTTVLSSGDVVLNGATLNNEATFVWSGGSFDTYNAPVINNHGIWDAQCDVGSGFSPQDSAQGTFNNYGTLERTTGTGTATFEGIRFDNLGGAIDIASSTINIAEGTSTGGTFSVPAGTTLSFDAYHPESAQTITGTYTSSGTGTIVLGGANLTLAIGPAGATFDFTPGQLQWISGTIAGPGTLTIPTTLDIDPAYGVSISGATLNLSGTTVWSSGYISTANAPVVNNYGTWDAQANDFFSLSDSNPGSFNNYGTLERTTGTGTADFEYILFNNLGGSIDVASNMLQIGGGASSGGSINVATGATVSLASYNAATQTITGTYTGSGGGSIQMTGGDGPLTLAIGSAGATFDFAPGYLQVAGGTVTGPGVLTNVGSLAITGAMTLDGVTLDNAGTVVWAAGRIYTANGPVVNNTGTWDAQANEFFEETDSTPGTFNNSGTVERTTGTGTGDFEQVLFNNLGGAIDVASTALQIGGGASTGGSFNVAAGATVYLASYSAATQTITGTYTGSGGGTLQLYAGDGPLDLAIGSAGATFDFARGLFQWTGGPIDGPGTLTNAGSLTLTGTGTLYLDPGRLVNSGTITVSGQTLDIGSGGATASVENTGSLGAQAGGVVKLNCPLATDGSGIVVGQRTGTILVNGNLTGDTHNADQYAPISLVQFGGNGTAAAPQLMEAMSQDLSASSAGFTDNFAYDRLIVGSGTYVRLVDQGQNVAALDPEAVYVNTLIVRSGATLDLNGLHIYAHDTEIDGTVTGGTVTTLAPGGPIMLNTPTPGKIAMVGQIDDWTFFGRAGQAVTIIGNPGNGTPAPLYPKLGFAKVTVLDPQGNALAVSSSAFQGDVVSLLNVTLPTDGTYHVQMQAPVLQASATGHYVLSVWNSQANVRSLVLGQQVVGQIATAYAVDRWTFSATANTAVQFQWVNASGPIQFALTGPGGWTGFSGLTGNSGPITLPTAGSYTLTASSSGEQGGAYAFRLVQLSVTGLTLGTPYGGTLADSGQSQLFQVTVPTTAQLLVTLTDGNFADQNEVYVSYGAPPTRASYQYRSATPAATNQQVLVPTATAGTWYILVYGNLVLAAGSYTLTASVSNLFLTSVTPPTQGTASDAVLILSGLGFTPAPAISLVADGGAAYPAASVLAQSATRLVATFTAGSVPAGLYTVRASAADGSTATLNNAFALLAGGEAHLTASIVVPDPIGRHIASTIYVDYSNTGNVAMAAPLLALTATANGEQGALLTLDASLQTEGFWTSANPVGYAQSVQFLASGAEPGILQPGESEQVPVYYGGWLHDLWTAAPVSFSLSVLATDNTQTIDWPSLQTTFQPSTIITRAWDAVYPGLTAQLGATWGSFVQRLDADAQYLAGLGENVYELGQLTGFEIEQANGFSPLPSLAGGTDAAVATPGLSLNFARTFLPGIIARNQFGPFGWGWSDSWQSTATPQADGTVLVAEPGGGRRIFQPDSRPGGAYFAQPGDHGSLIALAGGGYLLTETTGDATAYNPDGTLNYVQDTNGNRITAGYTFGILTSLTHSSGQSLTIAYGAGVISSITDSDGRTTTYHYDPTNQYLTSVVYFNGETTSYAYDTGTSVVTDHALLSVAYPDGTHAYLSYDGHGRLSGTHTDGGAENTTFTYTLGQVKVNNALNDTTEYFFDTLGLLARVQDPLGNDMEYAYDQNFNLVQTTDPLGQTYTNTYDAQGNVLSTTNPLGQTVRFAYSSVDNRPASYTDANGNTTAYSYDGRGNLTSTTYANGTVASIAYDPIGNVLSATDANGQATHYTYDAAGNVLAATYTDGSTVNYTYDAHDNLTSATNTDGTTTLTYDLNDRLEQISYPSGRYLKYTYDSAGRRIAMVDQTGYTVNYNYNALGQLAGLTDGSGNTIVTYSYDSVGRLGRQDNGNGTYTTYAYDADGNVLHLVNYAPDGAVNSRFDYTYDSLGQQITEATLDGTWAYSYDAIGELVHAVFVSINPSLPNQDLSYAYDAAGNRTQTVMNGVTTTYTTNNMNQYTQIGGTTYGYDADGNLISATDGGVATTYRYNTQHHLVEVAGPGGSSGYRYDVFGNLSATTQNGVTTRYLIDPAGLGNVVSTYDATGNLFAHYNYGLGLTSLTTAAGAQQYYDFDALGSTVGLTGPTGSYVATYHYVPFGATTATGTAPNPFQYVGRAGVMAVANGLQFMRARFYDALQGRFTQPDRIGLRGGTNLYAYTGNSPVKRVDPSGMVQFLAVYMQIVEYITKDALIPGEGFNSQAYQLLNRLDVIADANPEALASFGKDIGAFQDVVVETSGTVDTFVPALVEQGAVVAEAEAAAEGAAALGAAAAAEGGALATALAIGETVLSVALTALPFVGLGLLAFAIGYGLYTYRNEIGAFFDQLGDAVLSILKFFFDPNAMYGPAGVGPENVVGPDDVLPYRVDFENSPTATAPVQVVTVTNKLDPNFDWTTFALTQVGFGNVNITIPPGTQNYQTDVNMTENGQTFQVQITLGINAETGEVFAEFYAIDPATGLPPADVLTGFLPPEDGTGRGTGYFSYTVQPKTGLPVGTQIRNIAVITFGNNAPITTDQVDDEDPSKGVDPAKQALITIGTVATQLATQVSPAPVAGGKCTVTVSAVDAQGNIDVRYNGTAGLLLSGAPKGGKLASVLTAVFQNGVATFTNLSFNAVGNYTLIAVSNTDLIAASTTVKVVAPPQFKVTLAPATSNTSAGQPFKVTIAAMLGGKPDTGYLGTILLTSSDPQAAPAMYTFSLGDGGKKTVTITLLTPGKQIVTVADIGRASARGKSNSVTVAGTPPSTIDHFTVTGLPASDVTGTTHTVTITAVTIAGTPVVGYTGTVHITSSDPAFKPFDATVSRGVAHASATLTTLGSQSLTATDGNGKTGSENNVTVVSPATKLSVTASATSPVAGTPMTVSVAGIIRAGQPDTQFPDVLTLSTSDPHAQVSSTPISNGKQTFTVTFQTAGKQTIAISDLTRPAIKGPGLTAHVFAGSASQLSIAGFPAFAVAGTSHTFTVTAQDQFGNTAPTFTDAISVAGQAYTFKVGDKGTHTFTTSFPTSGIASLTATDNTHANVHVGTQAVTVVGAAVGLATDPGNGADSALVVVAPAGGGMIVIAPTNTTGTTVSVTINKKAQSIPTPSSPLGHILVYCQSGNATVDLVSASVNGASTLVSVPALVLGGSGTAVISAAGSSADNILIGGQKKSTVTGGSGHDILIGGGPATLIAGNGDDILIAGNTINNADPAALLSLMSAWSASTPYQQRVQALFAGPFDAAHVVPTAGSSHLVGGTGQDWFWLAPGDVLSGKAGDIATLEV
jgi:RHS repeat-associated protein